MAALSRADIAAAPLPENERKLLEFTRKVTVAAYRITAEDTAALQQLGWTGPQIAEAVYVAGLFALFNRVADAFGLADPGYFALAAQGQSPPAPAESGRPDASGGEGAQQEAPPGAG